MPTDADLYVERLSVRGRWWLVVLAMAVFGSVEISAGLGWTVAVIALVGVLIPTVALLAGVGRATVRVDAGGVHAGRQTMNYDDMESVEVLDAAQTRLQLGLRADPSAHLVVRGYIPTSVLIRPLRAEPVPYWLLSSRHPQQLLAAVEQAARTHLNS
jgi:hypothetical protein